MKCNRKGNNTLLIDSMFDDFLEISPKKEIQLTNV